MIKYSIVDARKILKFIKIGIQTRLSTHPRGRLGALGDGLLPNRHKNIQLHELTRVQFHVASTLTNTNPTTSLVKVLITIENDTLLVSKSLCFLHSGRRVFSHNFCNLARCGPHYCYHSVLLLFLSSEA